MLMILHYQAQTKLQHPDTIHKREYTCVLQVEIPHTEIHNSPQSRSNSV